MLSGVLVALATRRHSATGLRFLAAIPDATLTANAAGFGPAFPQPNPPRGHPAPAGTASSPLLLTDALGRAPLSHPDCR